MSPNQDQTIFIVDQKQLRPNQEIVNMLVMKYNITYPVANSWVRNINDKDNIMCACGNTKLDERDYCKECI